MINKPFKVGFLSVHNPMDRKASSGTTYKIAESCRNMGGDIIWLRITQGRFYKLCSKILGLIHKLGGPNVIFGHTPFGARLLSHSVDSRTINQCDLVFAPFSSSGLYTLKTDNPIIYLSDATFHIMVGYYFKNITPYFIKQGEK